jgi:hypothetical protein
VEQYSPKTPYVFVDEKRKQLAILRKKIAKFGIDPNELGIFSQESPRLADEKMKSLNQILT